MNNYNYFCTGCGLCKSVFPDEVEVTQDRFRSFNPHGEAAIDFCERVCLCCDDTMEYSQQEIFGSYKYVGFTYSTDDMIRRNGSTGGTLTAIAVYLISHHLVDGIIQVQSDGPFGLRTRVNTTAEEVIACAGSRYIDSNNLEDILSIVEEGKRYCFVGKPCEVSTLRRYAKINPEVNEYIVFMLSFFCAGAPSIDSNKKLVESIGCKEEECDRIAYRGNGWPGKTIVTDKHGSVFESTYENSWMNYLGRDTRNICRFCIDGVGERADISCGDAWYLVEGKPDFSEREGRNITFARSEKGLELINAIIASGHLHSDPVPNLYEYLKLANPYQYTRRATLRFSILAMKLTNKPYPQYNKRVLRGNSKYIPFIPRVRRLFGTLKRIVLGRI